MSLFSVARDAEPVIRDVAAVMFGDSEKLGAEARELLYGQAARSERADELSRAIEKANEQPSVKATSWFTERSDREDDEFTRSGQWLSRSGLSARDKELELWNPPNPNESDREIRVAQSEFNSWSARETSGEGPWDTRARVKDLISEEKFWPNVRLASATDYARFLEGRVAQGMPIGPRLEQGMFGARSTDLIGSPFNFDVVVAKRDMELPAGSRLDFSRFIIAPSNVTVSGDLGDATLLRMSDFKVFHHGVERDEVPLFKDIKHAPGAISRKLSSLRGLD